jgi:hypothetical protein
MKMINAKKEREIYETKLCHVCKSYLVYTRYPDNPIKNKGFVICKCGNKQNVYDPFLMEAKALRGII